MVADMRMSFRKQKGMLMLECMIALALFSIGVLGIVLMQAIASENSLNSEDRVIAASLANDLIAELWTNGSPAIPADYSNWTDAIAKSTLRNPHGTLTPAGTQATVTITWDRKTDTTTSGDAQYSTATYSTQVTIQ
jgi:type IV pilus assembly protein PilV